MPYYTHHKKMASHHYVSVDNRPDYSAEWKSYYKHDRKMGVHRYVYFEVWPI